LYIFTRITVFRNMTKIKHYIVFFIFTFAVVELCAQSFLRFNYGASIPSGNFSQSADFYIHGHAQTGLGLQSEWYTMVGKKMGLGLHYSFSFNNADFLRAGYRYAETYTNIVAGKYMMNDITGLFIFKLFEKNLFSASARFSGGYSFVKLPEIKKLYYENDVLVNEELLMNRSDQTNIIWGLGADIRYAVSERTGINLLIDYQNRFNGKNNNNPELRNFNIEQVFALLGIDFILGKLN